MPQDSHIDLSAARRYIRQRYSRSLSLPSLWRYCVHGQRGVRLAHVRVGRALRVTREGIDHFFRQVADAYAGDLARPAGEPADTSAHARAEAELDAAGV